MFSPYIRLDIIMNTCVFRIKTETNMLQKTVVGEMPNVEIHRTVANHFGKYDMLLVIVKKRKLRWFGHVARENHANTISQGKVDRKKS